MKMTKKQRTKDEFFIISLYESALKAGNLHTHFNRYEIGKLCGINPKGVEAICKLLVQCNFIKKVDDKTIVYLTKQGEELALRLLHEL